ncbi:MAG: 3-hydroxyacyl-CoA dehydrogenase NAD-binding domain-containing protein [Chloroflexota bacterium]|nr:3-hydroxyacyl-CoA dehydrogenase NAD-binding domain-containing protein [Chloroflexota bacterium]
MAEASGEVPNVAHLAGSPRYSAWFEHPDEAGIGRIVIDRPDDAVNAVDVRLIDDFGRAVRAARTYDGLRGLTIVSGKVNQFMAGADLQLVSGASDAHQLASASRQFQAVLDELTWLPCTTVAVINGPALGAGLELALACDYRVGLDTHEVSLGQPEVNLGLVPAGGGTQRLPRLVGLQRALDLILSGRRLNARRAQRAGLLDDLVDPAVLDRAARAWASKPKRPLDRPLHLGLTMRAVADVAELIPIGRQLMYRQAEKAVLARTHGLYPAPLRALEAVESGFEHGLAAGLEAESRAFGELATTPTARNLIWLFMATQKQKRRASAGQSTPVQNLGVVGAGFMGAAIAELGASSGLRVRLRDAAPDALARGLARVRKMVDDGVAHRRIQRLEGRQIYQRVSGTTDYSGFSKIDLVIEAVFENIHIKRSVVGDLEAVLPADTVIASNTSALPIAEIARGSLHPQRVIGMHFFSPAERMPLVEVVRPPAAAEWAIQRAVTLGTTLGKTVIVVSDMPGFYTSRVLGVMMNEAGILLGEGARMEAVDRAMLAFGFPVGPFVLFDEVGLEVARHAGETLTHAFGHRIPSMPIVHRLVEAGHTGKRAGAGFYVWPRPRTTPHLPRPLRGLLEPAARVPNPAVYRMSGSPKQRDFDADFIQDRLTLLFVNEAIRCLEEGVLQSPADGDLGAVLGVGFPAFRGGPFHYADSLGPELLASRLEALAARHGSRYQPAGLLTERARAKRTFFDERSET